MSRKKTRAGEIQVGTLMKQVEDKGVEQTALEYSQNTTAKKAEEMAKTKSVDLVALENQIRTLKAKYERLREKQETDDGKKLLEKYQDTKIILTGKYHVKKCIKPLIAELIGTFFLAYVAVLVNLPSPPNQPKSSVAAPLAVGLVIAAIVMTFGGVSGAHLNLSVSIGFLMLEMGPGMCMGYVLSQIIGATLAGLTVRITMPATAYKAVAGGMSLIPSGMTNGGTVFIDAIFTFFLMLLLCHMVCDSEGNNLVPFGVGLYVIAVVLATSSMGCSINPSVTIGLAIAAIGGNFTIPNRPVSAGKPWMDAIFHTIGSILGAIIAVILYRFVTTMNPRYEWFCCCCKPEYPIANSQNQPETQLEQIDPVPGRGEKSASKRSSRSLTDEDVSAPNQAELRPFVIF